MISRRHSNGLKKPWSAYLIGKTVGEGTKSGGRSSIALGDWRGKQGKGKRAASHKTQAVSLPPRELKARGEVLKPPLTFKGEGGGEGGLK